MKRCSFIFDSLIFSGFILYFLNCIVIYNPA
ncbi:hypothetical protein LINGRAPRIM_LOCUS1945 [Linum grandiflorum]